MSISTDYLVTGMTCAHCVSSVTEELSAVDGVDSVAVDLTVGGASTVTVTSATPLADADVRAAKQPSHPLPGGGVEGRCAVGRVQRTDWKSHGVRHRSPPMPQRGIALVKRRCCRCPTSRRRPGFRRWCVRCSG